MRECLLTLFLSKNALFTYHRRRAKFGCITHQRNQTFRERVKQPYFFVPTLQLFFSEFSVDYPATIHKDMSQQKSEETHFAVTPSFGSNQPTQRMVQQFFLVWIDPNIDQSTADYHSSLTQLRDIVNDVATFKQQDDAIDFLTDAHEMSGFLIVTDTIGQQILPLIHDISILDTIYILTTHQLYQNKQWTEKWAKIKGTHADIPSICKALELPAKQCDQDSIAVSFVNVS